MKKILIDISSLKENNQNAVLGIKYFNSKNSQDELTVIGDSNYTVTIHRMKRITIAQLDTDDIAIEEEYKNIKEKNLRILFSLLKRERFDSFVTFNTLDELKPYIDKYFIKKSSPLLVASYANYKTHKCTIFGDLGFNAKPTRDDMASYLLSLKEYASKVYGFKTPKFKLLSNGITHNNDLINLFKNDNDYQGELLAKDIYKADTDILLTDATTCSIALSAIDGAIATYDEFMKEQVKKSVGLRYLVFPMFRSVVTDFHLNIDQKLISGGMTLLGYDKKIVFVNKDVIAMGVKASIDNCSKF